MRIEEFREPEFDECEEWEIQKARKPGSLRLRMWVRGEPGD
jgi:hypothetical protein